MTIFYPDISHYQSGLSLRGATLVIAKATQGTSFTDPAYAGFRSQAASLGIPFVAYHWVDTSDLQAQARHAHSVIGSTPAMWDCEASGATVGRIVDLTSRYRALGGVVHLCYLPHWWWQDHLGSPDLRPLSTAGLALASSNYPSSGYSDSGPGWRAYGGMTPVAWQYTDAQLFNGQRVDFNAFKGSVTQLWALLTGGTTVALTSDDVRAVVEGVMNRDINGRRVADILGAEDPTNLALPGRLDALQQEILAAISAQGPTVSLDEASKASIAEFSAAVNKLAALFGK